MTGPQDYAKRRFLIVDDKAFIRAVVRGMLIRLKAAEVIEAANGAQARGVLAARGSEIDCVICDWNMHPVTGLELLQGIRTGAIVRTPRSLCFVMLTGHASEAIVKAAIGLDVNAYLVKPVSFEKLIRTVNQALTQRIALRAADDYGQVAAVQVPDTARPEETEAPEWMKTRSSREAQFRDRITVIKRELLHRSIAGIMNSRRERIGAVEPGQVLAEDLFADADVLLAPAGTVITPALLAHFKAFAAEAGGDAHLWVGDAVPAPASARND